MEDRRGLQLLRGLTYIIRKEKKVCGEKKRGCKWERNKSNYRKDRKVSCNSPEYFTEH